MVKLTIPEFVVALFNLDPTQCRLTITGRIANLHGFAYQVQSLLFDHVQYTHFSYRTTTARLCTETSDSLTDNISASSASFSIETLIDTLKNINPKPSNTIASIFGKDAAWSWQWPATVFVIGAILFYLFNWFSPSFSSLTDYCLAMVSTAILFTVLGTRPLRFLFDLPLFRRRFRTSLNMLVARAAIFDKVKALPSEEKEVGVIPTIMKLIDEDDGETDNYAIAHLLKNLEETKTNLEKTTEEKENLEDEQEKLRNEIKSLRLDNDNLNNRIGTKDAEISNLIQSCATAEALHKIACENLEKTKKELADEKESHANKVDELNDEISKLSAEFPERKHIKMARVLAGVLIYIRAARGVSQEELGYFFQRVHDIVENFPEQNKRFDTKLQIDSVRDTFSLANNIFEESKLKEEWFKAPKLIKEMLDRFHPAPKALQPKKKKV